MLSTFICNMSCSIYMMKRATYENYYIHIKHRHSIIWNVDTFNSNTCLVLGSSLQTWIQVESTCSGNTDVETKLYKLKRNFIPFLQWRSHNHISSLSQIFTYKHRHICIYIYIYIYIYCEIPAGIVVST